MGLFTNIKAQRAMVMQSKGDTAGARKMYEECMKEGLNNARFMLGYAVLLIRSNEFEKAKELLKKVEKVPGLTEDQKTQLFMDYAVCCFKLGETEKGINLLERRHQKQTAGIIYQALGYLYVEQYDAQRREQLVAELKAKHEREAADKAAAVAEKEAVLADIGEAVESTEKSPVVEMPDIDAEIEAAIDKAEAYIAESVDYDDEDPVCLDNMGQFLYRVKGDKAGAKQWFEKALKVKSTQIDTLWFLSRYDVENGDKKAALEKLETIMDGNFSPMNYCTRAMAEEEMKNLSE